MNDDTQVRKTLVTLQQRVAELEVLERQHTTAQEANQTRLQELTAIYRASQHLQRLYTPEILAQKIIAVLEETLDYTFGAVLLIDEASDSLMPFALSEQGKGFEFVALDKAYVASRGIRIGRGITGWVAQHGKSVRLGDVRQDARYYGIRDDIRSELCVPLFIQDKAMGVVNVETTEPDAYSESDQYVLETIAAQIAVAIQNARLHQQLEAHNEVLEATVQQRTLELQEALAAEKELNLLKTRFISTVSHDFRTPLAVIKTSCDLLVQYGNRLSDEKKYQHFDKIQKQIQHMTRLMEDTLVVSRADTVGLAFNPEAVDLADVCRDICEECLTIAPTHEIRFACIGEYTPQHLFDEALLRQALTNLLTNAIKYSPPDEPIQFDLVYAETHTLICVADKGIGIPEQDQPHLFDTFFRATNVGTVAGTGLGLDIVKRAVAAHGGTINFESREGEGTTFMILLPTVTAM
jgi:signal transduction histidine kinase